MTEKEQLLERAEALGLKFAKNVKMDTISKAIKQAELDEEQDVKNEQAGLAEKTVLAPTEDEIREQLQAEYDSKLEAEMKKVTANLEVNIAAKAVDSINNTVSLGQAKLKARREALALVRVIVSQKDPMKSNWEGEIITVGNDIVGDVKKYVPFNLDEGYHIPRMIANVLKGKECTIFINKRVNGQNVQTAKLIKAYSVTELQPLTQEELDELAADQSARHAIDSK